MFITLLMFSEDLYLIPPLVLDVLVHVEDEHAVTVESSCRQKVPDVVGAVEVKHHACDVELPVTDQEKGASYNPDLLVDGSASWSLNFCE